MLFPKSCILFYVFKKIFPDGEWKEYKLSTETIINWSYPIVYRDYPTWIVPTVIGTTVSPTITYSKGPDIQLSPSKEFNTGVFNIEN